MKYGDAVYPSDSSPGSLINNRQSAPCHEMQQKNYALLLALLATAFLFIPWLGDTYFYTKGEPREAIVAVSMLNSGDWILPVSYGADIPYKPPFMAWLIAIFSMIFSHGHVTEFTARLPSAIAAVGLLCYTWSVVRRHDGANRAWLTLAICATSFEVFRAATGCRVDMVLTACMTGAIFAMSEMKGHPGRVITAILLMSGAVLTKGPVGALLPCLATGLFMLFDGRNFWRTLLSLTAVCLASIILPALWYYAAWQRGGDEFLSLALEENIGRLTGTMSYDSHINPWYYNITSILAGMLPWTLPVLVAICYRRVRRAFNINKVRHGLSLLAIVAGLTIFIFYCIPASKRSVYLLPCYPFLAFGAAWALEKMSGTRFMAAWSVFLSVLGIIASIAAVAIAVCLSHGIVLVRGVAPLQWWLWPMAVLPGIFALWWLFTRSRSSRGLYAACVITYILVLSYNAAYMPMFLNGRSDVTAARTIEKTVPADAPIQGVIEEDRLIRYYSINFYLNDRLRRAVTFAETSPDAWVIASRPDSTRTVVDTLTRRSADTRRPVLLMGPRDTQP